MSSTVFSKDDRVVNKSSTNHGIIVKIFDNGTQQEITMLNDNHSVEIGYGIDFECEDVYNSKNLLKLKPLYSLDDYRLIKQNKAGDGTDLIINSNTKKKYTEGIFYQLEKMYLVKIKKVHYIPKIDNNYKLVYDLEFLYGKYLNFETNLTEENRIIRFPIDNQDEYEMGTKLSFSRQVNIEEFISLLADIVENINMNILNYDEYKEIIDQISSKIKFHPKITT
jgi:hypothetical protein